MSKEARDSATTLIEMLNRSPAWQKEICTLEAKVSFDERERTHLLEDLVAGKLHALSFGPASIKGFRTAFGELTGNAFEHGTKEAKSKVIRMVVDVSPTYVTTVVFNPRGSTINLNGWIEKSRKHLRDTKLLERGRGLLTVIRQADVLEPIEPNGIKAVVYRDAVTFETTELEDSTLVLVTAGHSNPSFGRRVVDYVRRLRAGKIALCLDPSEIREREEQSQRDQPGSWVWQPILQLVASYAQAGDKSIRIVCSDEDLRDLLPEAFVSATVDAALQAMNAERQDREANRGATELPGNQSAE